MPAPPSGGREGPVVIPSPAKHRRAPQYDTRHRSGSCGLAEVVVQGGAHHIGCFFGQEVARGQRSAANVACVLLPDADRLIVTADERLRSPQRQDGAFDLLPSSGGLLV